MKRKINIMTGEEKVNKGMDLFFKEETINKGGYERDGMIIKILDNETLWDIIKYLQKDIKKKWKIEKEQVNNDKKIKSFWYNLGSIIDAAKYRNQGFIMYNDKNKLVCYLIYDVINKVDTDYDHKIFIRIIETVKKYRYNGYARDLIQHFESYCRIILNIHSIHLNPIEKVIEFWIKQDYIQKECDCKDYKDFGCTRRCDLELIKIINN